MHVHLPKPLHGWRAFVGEVGIIVLGVIIALAFEQLVGRWQWREKVAETTRQLDAELHRDARSAYEGLAVVPCLDQQLHAIDVALTSARQTGRLQPTPAFTPPLHMFTEDSWLNARALQVTDHFSAEQIQDYSRLFFYPRDLGVGVIELHKEAAELRPLRTGIFPISTQEIGDYQRQAGRVRELLDRVELGEALLLMALDQRGIRPTQKEMARSLEGDRQWAGQCASPPDPISSLRKLADSSNPPV